MNNQTTMQKFAELKKFDYPIAAVIACFAREKCVYCKNSSKCSSEKKRLTLSDNDRDCCDEFDIDPDLCRLTLLQVKKDHPEYATDAINCETTSEL